MPPSESLSLANCWPIKRDGPLPDTLLSPEYLEKVFFRTMPIIWECSAQTVRRALKTHLKKTIKIKWKLKSVATGQGSRDRMLAYTVCNIPESRERIDELVLLKDVSFEKFGREQERHLVIKSIEKLPALLWNYYGLNSEYEDFVKWSITAGIKRPDIGKGYYLTAASLDSETENGEIPISVSSNDFSRAILLFGALLPPDEMIELFQAAACLGCETFDFLQAKSANGEEIKSIADEKTAITKQTKTSFPKLVLPCEPSSENLISVPDEIETLALKLIQLEADYIELEKSAEVALPSQSSKLLELEDNAFDKAIHLMAEARELKIITDHLTSDARNQINKLRQSAFDEVGIGTEDVSMTDIDNTPCKIAAELREASEILSLTAFSHGMATETRAWREQLSSSPTKSDFEHLAKLCEIASLRQAAFKTFRDSIANFIHDEQSTTSILLWLRNADADVTVALLPDLNSDAWVIPGSILLRISIERGQLEILRDVSNALSQTHGILERRSLLRFCDPASSIYDEDPFFRRIVAVERFRDVIHFGPIAQISDPASGLSDTEVVGQTVKEITALINNHLDILPNEIKLQSIVNSERKSSTCTPDFQNFVNAPITGGGIYKRLRERARENSFLPLIHKKKFDVDTARDLLKLMSSEQFTEEIIEKIENESSKTKIENRHRLQLKRYLETGRKLIEACLAENSNSLGKREKNFQKRLKPLLQNLKVSEETGTLSWLEGEIYNIFYGNTKIPEHATLTGDTESIDQRIWSDCDTLWAKQFIDIPEFSTEENNTVLEISAAILRWRYLGRLPMLRDVIENLLEEENFKAALSAIDHSEETKEAAALKDKTIKLAESAVEEFKKYLNDLEKKFPDQNFSSSPTMSSVLEALSCYNLEEAADLFELLELELIDNSILDESNTEETSSSIRKSFLIRHLLLSGVIGIDNKSSIHDLESRWEDELKRRAPERSHLILTEEVFDIFTKFFPKYADKANQFKIDNLNANRWLPKEVANNFFEFIIDAADKFKAWIISSPAFEEKSQEALINLSFWFKSFVTEQALTLHSLEPGEASDSTLERIIEITDIICTSHGPFDSLTHLKDIGEIDEEFPSTSLTENNALEAEPDPLTVAQKAPAKNINSIAPTMTIELSTVIRTMIQQEEWQSVIELSCNQLELVPIDEKPLLEDVADFSRSMLALHRFDIDNGSELLPIAARLLSTNGPVADLFSKQERIKLALKILAASLSSDAIRKAVPIDANDDSLLAIILEKKINFLKDLADGNLSLITLKIVDFLVKGTFGGEVSDRLWESATNTNTPKLLRSKLMEYLYNQNVTAHIIRFASIHEPKIKTKLEQLFEIRNVTTTRPDLISVAQSLADQILQTVKAGPFHDFIHSLPSTTQVERPVLDVEVEQGILLRLNKQEPQYLEIPISIKPYGLVPNLINVTLFPEDDVTFIDGNRRFELANEPVYFATEYTLKLCLGQSWIKSGVDTTKKILRLQVNVRTVMDELFKEDVVCQIGRYDRSSTGTQTLDDTSLLEYYPGVGNTPARGADFIGRENEIGRLHEILISAREPSPVLLTGMRRIGKTSLLFGLHSRFHQPGRQDAVTIYLSLAERREALNDTNASVSKVVFKTIVHTLAKRNFSKSDHNLEVGNRLRERLGPDWREVRQEIMNCYDTDSLANSIIFLSEKLIEWLGDPICRIVFLIDEAETLVVPYQAGGAKRLELEQFLQSLREISQTSKAVGILLSGSNHINTFAREYKNAFFGSCVRMDLGGIKDLSFSREIIAPSRVRPYVQFEESAIEYAVNICAGMPQFMWQLGAATSFLVRSGTATRTDIRLAVTTLVTHASSELPFKVYDALEPLEHMLALQPGHEPDLLWLLLYRTATASSLIAEEARLAFILDHTIRNLRDSDSWKRRLLTLVELNILKTDRMSSYSFQVPLFAEAFRAPRNWQEFIMRSQRVSI